MRQVLKVVLPVVAAVLFLVPNAASAQTGAIAGQVRDASGGALPGVTVEVTSPALIEKVRASVTGSNGRYQITALPVGTYKVTFTLSNFGTVTRENIVVSSNFTANVVGEMKVGGLTDTVNVVAEAPVVDVQNARVQQVFQGTDIADLPTTRDVPSLMLLVPSLTSDSLRGVCSGGIGIFCNPTAPTFNSHVAANDEGATQGRIMVDGMVINAGRSGTNQGSANGLTIDTANTQEVSFTLSGSLGESETGGASINIVPRTGGNRFAGGFFTSYLQTKFFDRNRKTRLNNVQEIQEYNYDYDVNGSFSGPILKDRLWFHAYAGNRGVDLYPQGGSTPGFSNKNIGKWGANYEPNRDDGWLTFRNEYKKANVRLTLQATQKNKFNVYWDEQSSCTNPCYGMINVVDSPEAYGSLQSYPNRLTQLSWTNPFTNRLLFDAGLTYVSTHEDQTKHREFTNPRHIPRICEAGPTVGRDAFAIKVNTSVTNTIGGAGLCNIFSTMISGSINSSFPTGQNVVRNDDTYRSRASASYITGAHNAKIGFEGAYFAEKIRNEVNDMRLSYHYQTPATTGTWNTTTQSGNCLLAPSTQPFPCGNMSLYYPEDINNTLLRTKPVGFEMNTGPAISDERVWFGALYVQDQWTLNRFTINGALRYDHAESRYGGTCIGPDIFVPVQLDGTNSWCSEPAKGVRYNDITPRWGVAWDVFGNGKTSVKWNMGKYLSAANLGGLYVGDNAARRSNNALTRGWDDRNGNRIVDCEFFNPNPHTSAAGDFCGSLLQTTGPGAGQPSQAFATYGRPPTAAQLFNPNSNCGRTENSSALHQAYCEEAGQNLVTGWDKRRNTWQFGLGVQHELLPRLSAEVTYNRSKYGNLTDSDTINSGCDYFGPKAAMQDYKACASRHLNYESELYDFYTVTAPVDPRLPNGGGYVIRGLFNQKVQGALPSTGGNVTLIREDLEYAWNGVDTNFVLRARGGLRISGGTSTGRAVRDQCFTDIDTPNVEGRVGNEYGGGCRPRVPFQTNVRANASYTIPWVDVLMGAVFQYRPGAQRSANWSINNTQAVWEPTSAHRAGTQFHDTGSTPNATETINLLDSGDLYGEGMRMWDLKFGKNLRFGNKRVNIGVDIFNVFNSDAATGYDNNYDQYLVDGVWVEDNPATTTIVETQEWGRVTNIVTPRHAKLSIQFDF